MKTLMEQSRFFYVQCTPESEKRHCLISGGGKDGVLSAREDPVKLVTFGNCYISTKK